MNNISDDINKDLKNQPKFTDDIGSKNQEHHTFEQGEQSILKNSTFFTWKSNNCSSHNSNIKCNCIWFYSWWKIFLSI